MSNTAVREYVSFNDSKNDPTYSSADSVVLVLSPDDNDNDNPCVGPMVTHTPLIPNNKEELTAFAEFFGYEVVVMNDITYLRTNIK